MLIAENNTEILKRKQGHVMSYAHICRNLSSNKQTLRIVSTQIKKFYQTLYRLNSTNCAVT